MIKCENYLRYFKDYTDKFFAEVSLEDRYKIELKIVHTLNVVKLMRKVAKDAGLSGEDYEIAKVIALFHDFGRFNQIKLYGHFNDSQSINHAEESVREMKRLNILDIAGSEYVPEEKKELIYNAILNHNKDKDALEDIKDDRLLLFSKLIRDCDKIDIYRSVAEYIGKQNTNEFVKTVGLENNLYVSDGVYNKVKSLTPLKFTDKVTVTDDTIWDFYWVIADMNFPISLKIIKEKGYIDNMFNVLVETGKFKYEGRNKELYDFIIDEFNKRVENGTI